jgi:hypothetical protein
MACNLGCSEPPTVDLARFAEYTNLKSLYNAVIRTASLYPKP